MKECPCGCGEEEFFAEIEHDLEARIDEELAWEKGKELLEAIDNELFDFIRRLQDKTLQFPALHCYYDHYGNVDICRPGYWCEDCYYTMREYAEQESGYRHGAFAVNKAPYLHQTARIHGLRR